MSSGIAKWLVMACVSTASRRVRKPVSRSDSHTDLFHSILVAPQILFTRMCRLPCSLSMRVSRMSGLVEKVFSQMHATVPADGASWQDRVKDAAHAYRRTLRAHPNLA